MSSAEKAWTISDEIARAEAFARMILDDDYHESGTLPNIIRDRDAAIAAKTKRDVLQDLADEMDALDAFYVRENMDANTKHLFPDVAVGVGDHIRAMIEGARDA